jgi:cysteine-rich repeat protein
MRWGKALFVLITGALGFGCSVLVPFDRDKIGETGGDGGSGGGVGGTGGTAGMGGFTSSSDATTSTSSAGGMAGDGGSAGSTTSAGGSGGSPVCGDTLTEGTEECDDGNDVAGDGCDLCQLDCGCPGCMAGMPCADCGLGATFTGYKDPASKHCYLFDSTLKDWSTARAYCTAWGGDLAGISTSQEMTMILGSNAVTIFAAGDPNVRSWAGANDMATEGAHMWANGEPWMPPPNGPSWAATEPNGGEPDDCVTFRPDGTMGDRICETPIAYLCERLP